MRHILLTLLFTLISVPVFAGLYVAPQSLEQDDNGQPCTGCQLYFYQPGTTTLKNVYQDSALSTAHSNPVEADAAGRFDPIYMDGTYKVILKDADDVTIWSEDNYSTGASTDFFGESEAITTTTAIDASYEKKHLRVTGTVNLNLLDVATAGEGFVFTMINDGTGLVTIDPSGSEQINDASTWVVPPGSSGTVIAGQSEWSMIDTMGITQSLSTGSIFYYSAANSDTLTELAIGSTGQILLTSAGLPEWTNTLPGAYTFSSANTFSHTNSFTGLVRFPDDGELTIATGAVTVTGVYHTLDTESDAATDDLDTISGGADGQKLILRIENDARNVVLKHNTGNILVYNSLDVTLDLDEQSVTLIYDGTLSKWLVLSDTTPDLVMGAAQTSTSGTSRDFTGIPAGTKRITVNFSGVSVDGASTFIFQLGDAGGVETSGYLGASSSLTGASATNNYTAGCGLEIASAAAVLHGSITFTLIDSSTNTWAGSGVFGASDAARTLTVGCSKPLSATLDRVRITTSAGTANFDAGTINIVYEN